MLRLRPFDVEYPATLGEAISLLATHGAEARIIGGGTDAIPAMKLGRAPAGVLVSLRRVPEIARITRDAESLRLGALTPLAQIAASLDVLEAAPALAQAAARVASPQIRRMGTLAGNVCADTRCRYVDQSPLFRTALGGCLKSGGTECHVVPGGRRCVAALSSDCVPALVVHGAIAEIAGPAETRAVDVEELRGPDGARPLQLDPGEIVTGFRIPAAPATSRFTYRKWSVRRSIDFPLVSLALRLDVQDARLAGGRVAVGVLGPRAKVIELGAFEGAALDEGLADSVATEVFERCRPLSNVPYDPDYRRERLAVEARRAVRELVATRG